VATVQTHGMGIAPDPLQTTRDLLDRKATVRHGYLDVLGESEASKASETTTLAQRAMNSTLVAGVYERLWRPVAFYVASGVTTSTEQRRAADALRLSDAHTLLDIACGPGNFTGQLAQQLPDNSGPRTCYVRGDAGTLPFGDETFDAVCCFGALYLMPEPFRVAHEMVRVLRPGGRAAILTSYAGQSPPVRHAMTASARLIGLRMFDRHAFVDLFTSSGLVDVRQQTQRTLQFVTAGKPG